MVQRNFMKVNYFEELHPDELKKIIRNSGLVFFPIGSLEWHERHLPFGLDSLVSFEICKQLCERLGGCIIPPLYFGTDREHEIEGKIFHGMDAQAKRILPGSIYFLKQNFFFNLLKSIAKNIEIQGFRKMVIVSAHSGTAQQQTLEKLAQEKLGRLQIQVFPGKLFAGGIDHASKLETSLMLAIKPELVQLNKLTPPYEAISGDDSKQSNIKEGKKHLQSIVNQIEAEIRKTL